MPIISRPQIEVRTPHVMCDCNSMMCMIPSALGHGRWRCIWSTYAPVLSAEGFWRNYQYTASSNTCLCIMYDNWGWLIFSFVAAMFATFKAKSREAHYNDLTRQFAPQATCSGPPTKRHQIGRSTFGAIVRSNSTRSMEYYLNGQVNGC